MKKSFKIILVVVMFPLHLIAQSRNDAGLQGNAGAVSGFFDANVPVNFPVGATGWWHLLDVRHSNTNNNLAMQFAGSFFDQQLYFRKTMDNPSHPWSKVLLEINGKVGIGVTNPTVPLEVNGTAIFKNSAGSSYDENLRLPASDRGYSCIALGAVPGVSGSGFGQWSLLRFPTDFQSKFTIRHHDTDYFSILTDGNVGIGTVTPKEKLSVNGKIRAHEIRVESAAGTWPDYVFTQSYQLPSLSATETFVKKNGHLPEIPSAREVKENGVNLGEMDAKLLKKIEELTLHLIQKDKEIEIQNARIKRLEELYLKLKQ